jgi:Helicase conserved C-terminal domain
MWSAADDACVGVAASLVWHHRWCGTIVGVAPSSVWHHRWCGTIVGVAPSLVWHHRWCGTIVGVAPSLVWHHTISAVRCNGRCCLCMALQVLDDVDELMGAALLPEMQQLLHATSLPLPAARQTIALGSCALPQDELMLAARDILRQGALQLRAGWPLPSDSGQQHLAAGATDARAGATTAERAPAAMAAAAAAAAAASALPPSVSQRWLGVSPQLKLRSLLRLLASDAPGGLALVFTNSHASADAVAAGLEAAGVSAGVLHSGRSQAQRDEALQCFRYGVTQARAHVAHSVSCLLCTPLSACLSPPPGCL